MELQLARRAACPSLRRDKMARLLVDLVCCVAVLPALTLLHFVLESRLLVTETHSCIRLVKKCDSLCACVTCGMNAAVPNLHLSRVETGCTQLSSAENGPRSSDSNRRTHTPAQRLVRSSSGSARAARTVKIKVRNLQRSLRKKIVRGAFFNSQPFRRVFVFVCFFQRFITFRETVSTTLGLV